MQQTITRNLPGSIDETLSLLAKADYLADRSLATVLFLALRMGRPLFLEGEAGVGKTEVAKVLAKTLERKLIRLQCYEGLDIAAAVINAITDAIGSEQIAMPATPQAVWTAIRRSNASRKAAE